MDVTRTLWVKLGKRVEDAGEDLPRHVYGGRNPGPPDKSCDSPVCLGLPLPNFWDLTTGAATGRGSHAVRASDELDDVVKHPPTGRLVARRRTTGIAMISPPSELLPSPWAS